MSTQQVTAMAPFKVRAIEAAEDARQKMEDFAARMEPPTRNFFNEDPNKWPTFEDRCEIATQKALAAFEAMRKEIGP